MALSWALSRSGAISQCSLGYSLHIAGLSSSLFFSHHGPLIVRSAQLFHRSNGFTQLCTRLAVHNQFSQLSVSVFCSAPPTLARFNRCPPSCSGLGSMVSRIPILQTCNVVVVLKAVASFQHLPNLDWNLLDTEVSIHVYGSHGESNLTSFHQCVELRFTDTQGCQALKRGSRFHGVVTDLSNQSRSTFSGDWIASEIAVHEDCDHVKVFLSSKSQCKFWFPNQMSRCTFQRRIVDFTDSLGQMLCAFCKILICLGPNMTVSYTQICIVLHLLPSEANSFFRLTPTCLVVSLVVDSVSWCSRCIHIH